MTRRGSGSCRPSDLFTAQTWEVGGNEGIFFVQDVTGGNTVPFRVEQGAPNRSLNVSSSGDITTVAMLSQYVHPSNVAVTGAADGGAILAALRGLTLSRYTLNDDSDSAPHVGPAGAAFRSAFATGSTDDELASADMAGVALAAVKELDARVSALALPAGARAQRARRAPTARRQVSSRPTPGLRRSRSPTGSSRRAWPRSRSRSRRSRAAESPRRGWRRTIAVSCRRS